MGASAFAGGAGEVCTLVDGQRSLREMVVRLVWAAATGRREDPPHRIGACSSGRLRGHDAASKAEVPDVSWTRGRLNLCMQGPGLEDSDGLRTTVCRRRRMRAPESTLRPRNDWAPQYVEDFWESAALIVKSHVARASRRCCQDDRLGHPEVVGGRRCGLTHHETVSASPISLQLLARVRDFAHGSASTSRSDPELLTQHPRSRLDSSDRRSGLDRS